MARKLDRWPERGEVHWNSSIWHEANGADVDAVEIGNPATAAENWQSVELRLLRDHVRQEEENAKVDRLRIPAANQGKKL